METSIYRFHCPMAFNNKGAYWLQDNEDTKNPYFGSSMLICKDEVILLFPGKNKEINQADSLIYLCGYK